MRVESIAREVAILPHRDVDDFLSKEPNRWAVVSIPEPHHPEADLATAKRTLRLVFEDVGSSSGQFGQGPQPAHAQRILKFAKQTGKTPIVFQCWAGQSRSTAAALVFMVSELWNRGLDGPELVTEAIDVLVAMRPTAVPNRRVLRLGLSECVPHGLVGSLSESLVNDPRLAANHGI